MVLGMEKENGNLRTVLMMASTKMIKSMVLVNIIGRMEPIM